jgi:hypothetical protein
MRKIKLTLPTVKSVLKRPGKQRVISKRNPPTSGSGPGCVDSSQKK